MTTSKALWRLSAICVAIGVGLFLNDLFRLIL